MKKTVTIISTVLIFVLSIIIPVSAEDIYDNPFGYLFLDEYIKQYEPLADMLSYTELFYHKKYEKFSTDNIDWVLVRAYSYKDDFTNHLKYGAVIGDRVLIKSGYTAPFPMEYAIYDVNSNIFYDISEIDLKYYNGLEDCLDSLGVGLAIGDTDFDGKLTVLDSTEIQLVIAGLSEFEDFDVIKAEFLSEEKLVYISDIDRDGYRSVMDATAIQLKLAKLD